MNELRGKRIAVAVTGSFCTFDSVFDALEDLNDAELYPILSDNVHSMDTRFGTAASIRARLEKICGRGCWHTIQEVEPIGPQKLMDLVIVAPCTGNTLAKLALGVTDTPVTMAVKSQLRNGRPVLIGISTNDGLSASAKNIGILMERKNVFFVPFAQDDPMRKPASLMLDVADLRAAALSALHGEQMQPELKVRDINKL
jgi:dipicolinate synthase subunit B